MKPVESYTVDLQFASYAPPWLLVVCLPGAILLVCVLHRRQASGIGPWQARGLLLLRSVIVALIIFLAFQPNLLLHTILTYPGRIVLLLDDSGSMGTRDNSLTDTEALKVARGIEKTRGGPNEDYWRMARLLSSVEASMRGFEARQEGMDRSTDAFWNEVEKTQRAVLRALDRIKEIASSAAREGERRAARLRAILGEIEALPAQMGPFFQGRSVPEKQEYQALYMQVRRLAAACIELQSDLDRSRIEGKDQVLRARVELIRRKTRMELLADLLFQKRKELELAAAGQFLRVRSLLDPRERAFSELARGDIRVREGAADLVGSLASLASEENDFPLSPIIYCGDGRDPQKKPLRGLVAELTRKRVPVFAAGIGASNEPYDIAILDVRAPPFAVKNRPFRVVVLMKTVLLAQAMATLEIVKGANLVPSRQIALGSSLLERVEVKLTPRSTGLFRYTARIKPVAGEAFPAANNQADFAVNVREERVNVLLLDWRPRWETRFVLNILQRMDFIDLNAIIGMVQEDHRLMRGTRKGAWPENIDALDMYDLLIIGDLPEGLLTPREWKDIEAYVRERGKTVCFIGTGRRNPVRTQPGVAEDILPVRPGPDIYHRPVSIQKPASLALTDAGLVHPLTSALSRIVDGSVMVKHPRLSSETQALLMDRETGAPIIACRFFDRGKSVLIDTDQLWKLLNPRLLDGHAELYIAMVRWAVEGGYQARGKSKKHRLLGIDKRTYIAPSTIQAWIKGGQEQPMVIAEANGETIAEARAEPVAPGAALKRAVFRDLPPKDIIFRLKEQPEVSSHPMIIVEENKELDWLARDHETLTRIAKGTAGDYRPFTELEQLLRQVRHKIRVETRKKTWRIWDANTLLILLMCLLTFHWIWRKWIGLV